MEERRSGVTPQLVSLLTGDWSLNASRVFNNIQMSSWRTSIRNILSPGTQTVSTNVIMTLCSNNLTQSWRRRFNWTKHPPSGPVLLEVLLAHEGVVGLLWFRPVVNWRYTNKDWLIDWLPRHMTCIFCILSCHHVQTGKKTISKRLEAARETLDRRCAASTDRLKKHHKLAAGLQRVKNITSASSNKENQSLHSHPAS